jgi:hypothetical protein
VVMGLEGRLDPQTRAVAKVELHTTLLSGMAGQAMGWSVGRGKNGNMSG